MNPSVIVTTSFGAFTVELFEDKAPITVKNFLGYVDENFYDGTIFHRVIPNFMIQGGGFTPGMKQKDTKGNIKNESGNRLGNDRGTLAMARTSDPDSASAQFFVNVTDNAFLNKSQARDGAGYCVFARVTDGMDVVDKIKAVATTTKSGHGDVPVADVIVESIRRVG